jgi:putative membrane protein
MTRPRFDDAACDNVAQCIKEIEKSTDAELVIVVRARSGSYAHADYLFGFLVSFVVLLFLLFSSVVFHQIWVPIDVVVAFVAGAFISSRSNFLRRLLSTEKYRLRVTRTAAAATFYEAGIANTNTEMGVLIYLSLLERKLELIADRGILRKVPAQEWNLELAELQRIGRSPDPKAFVGVIKEFGNILTCHVPATGENPNELPDLPRFDVK